ncbi:MAG: hypothetical protein NT120_02785 [Candidatus Aenigmarchaeota archaeon]|nr:hypothetical protein [Candidatus Aenigmarchaeota archaeon]
MADPTLVIDPTIISVASGLIGVIIGGVLSFYAQKWYFKQTIKNDRNRDIYNPLLDELEFRVKEAIDNLDKVEIEKWAELKQTSRYRDIEENLRKELIQFFDTELSEYNNDIEYCHRAIYDKFGDEIRKDKNSIFLNLSNTKNPSFPNTILRYDTKEKIYVGSWKPFIPTIVWESIQRADYGIDKINTPFPEENMTTIMFETADKLKDDKKFVRLKQKRIDLLDKIKELMEKIEETKKK